jgi:hypothetical protein
MGKGGMMTKPLRVGDHVKVVGAPPSTKWESGCIESIEGQMAYIIYGVESLKQFDKLFPGHANGMGMPVPLSQLKAIHKFHCQNCECLSCGLRETDGGCS